MPQIPDLFAVQRLADVAAATPPTTVNSEADLVGQAAGQFHLSATDEIVAWNGTGITARGPMPASIGQVNSVHMLAQVATAFQSATANKPRLPTTAEFASTGGVIYGTNLDANGLTQSLIIRSGDQDWSSYGAAGATAGQVQAVKLAAANLKTGAIDALAQANPAVPDDVASAGNSNFRYIRQSADLGGVSLDDATQQQAKDSQGYPYLPSYFLRDPNSRFTPGHVGMQVSGDGIPDGTIIVRYNDPSMVWLSQPATRTGTTDVQIRHRRYGKFEVPIADGTGAWRFEYEYEGSEQSRLYAWDFGFRPGNSKAANYVALQQALDYAAIMKFDVVVLPPGDSACAGGAQVSGLISVRGQGQCRIDCVGNGDTAIFTVGESYTRTLDMRGASFTSLAISSIRGIIFFSSGSREGAGIDIGNLLTTDTVAGAAYKVILCGFDHINRGMSHLNNVWCTDVAWSFFYDNNFHVKHQGVHNSGENMSFTNTHFAQCTGYAFRLEGRGCTYNFERCSFDYNVAGFLFSAPGYILRFHNSWIEYSSGNAFLGSDGHFKPDTSTYPANTGYASAVYCVGTTLAKNGQNAGPFADNSLGVIPISMPDCSIWQSVNGVRVLEHEGARIVTVPEGQDRLQVPMEWCSELTPPIVQALGQPGSWWWTECPAATAGVAHDHFTLALQSKAPTGGVRFSVRYS